MTPRASAAVAPWAIAQLDGAALACLRGKSEDAIALLACDATCQPIPWQLDERTDDGRWALADGPEPNPDQPPNVVDDNDVVLWMAGDSGRRARPGELPKVGDCAVEVSVVDGDAMTWVYLVAVPPPAPRSPRRYVTYDPQSDIVAGERVALGFGAPTPRFLALRAADGSLGSNLLDRLKVRAHARFFGIIPLGRDEDDIQWSFAAWRAGPIRVLRREYQWVRLGFGLRTPIFETESLVTRATVELPVRLRLNFPPSYFFSGIEVQAVLDFRDLRGWQVAAEGKLPAVVGSPSAASIDGQHSDWVALRNGDFTLILQLVLGESLRSVAPTVLYRETAADVSPEGLKGEMPAIGFRLAQWSQVERGAHQFAALAYALPADFDLATFSALRATRVVVEATEMRHP